LGQPLTRNQTAGTFPRRNIEADVCLPTTNSLKKENSDVSKSERMRERGAQHPRYECAPRTGCDRNRRHLPDGGRSRGSPLGRVFERAAAVCDGAGRRAVRRILRVRPQEGQFLAAELGRQRVRRVLKSRHEAENQRLSAVGFRRRSLPPAGGERIAQLVLRFRETGVKNTYAGSQAGNARDGSRVRAVVREPTCVYAAVGSAAPRVGAALLLPPTSQEWR